MAKKYIDAEKLIAEIERRIKENEVLPHRYIRLDEDKQLLSFITSLQQEQPEIELNEETLREEFHTIDRQCFDEGIEGWQREKLIARRFYELGKNSK